MFRATYADNLPALEGKQQWDYVDPGFKLCAPIQNRPPGRPRKQRIRSTSEGKGLGPRKYKCKRCGRCGHKAKGCKESVDLAFGEEEHLEQIMQMIIQQLMSQQKQKYKMRRRKSQKLMFFSSRCHHQRKPHMRHLHKLV